MRLIQWLGSGTGILPARIFEDFWTTLSAAFISGGTGFTRTPPIEVFVTWPGADAGPFVRKFDPQTGFLEFNRPMGIFPGTVSMRTLLTEGAKLLRKLGNERDKELQERDKALRTPDQFSLATCLIARHIDMILTDDQANSGVANSISAFFPPLFPFSAVVNAIKLRNPGFPLWQVASPKNASEQKRTQPDPTTTPAGVTAVKRESAPEGASDGTASPDVQAPTGGETGSTVVAPSTGNAGSTTGSTTTTTPGPTVTTSQDAGPGVAGAIPQLKTPPVVASFFVEVPFDEAAWPCVEIGGIPPARIETVNVPWVQDLGGNPLTLETFRAAALKKFEEINSPSTVEESEEIQIANVFKSGIGGAVRSITHSWDEGGRNPTTIVSGASLLSRRFATARAIDAQRRALAAVPNPAPKSPIPQI